MALRKRKPTSPGRRFQTVVRLLRDHQVRAREVAARQEAAHRRPQHLRSQDGPPPRRRPQAAYRIIDFRRNKDGVPAKVAAIEYDPNRNCRIALLHYHDGEKRYILAPARRAGRRRAPERPGLRDPRRATPCRCATSPSARRCTTWSSRPGAGGKMARSAGTSVQLVAKEGDFATLRLPSTEMRRVPDRLPGHGRRGRQRRGRPRQDRQGRPQPLEGRPPPDPRRGHEPRRPPPRRWRGQDLRWPPPGVAVGQARGPHPRPEQDSDKLIVRRRRTRGDAGGSRPCPAA